jgi:parvulin-like peptidyl-prolyl isomerase
MPLDRTSEPFAALRRFQVAGGFVAVCAGLAFVPSPTTLLAQVQGQYSDSPGVYGAQVDTNAYGGQPNVQAIPLSPQPYAGQAVPAGQPAPMSQPGPGYPGQAPPAAYAPPQAVEAIPLGTTYGAAPTGPAPGSGQPQNLPPYLPPTDATLGATGQAASLTGEDVPIEGELFESGKVVGRVGRETILAGDILGMVNQQIQAMEKSVPKEQIPAFRREAEKYRRARMAQLTEMTIGMKLLYFDFLRLVPPERQVELKNKIGASFREHEAPRMMEAFEVDSEEALDAKLRTFGSSLKKAQQLYIEKTLGMILLKQKIDDDPKVSHQELLDLYEAKKDIYFQPSRVKYEELVVKISKFPSKGEAWAELADMGNEVLRGAPLSAVAKRRSQGIGAATSGGQSDWTGKGSLVTTKVEEALFQIPLGKLSQIIEDGDAFYIVRVQEREGERYTPFANVQEDLREEIKREKIGKAQDEYILGLYAKTHVWNAFEHEAVQSIADRRRELLAEEDTVPLFLLGKNDKPKGAAADTSSGKPDATQEPAAAQVPGGGSFEPAPSEYQPSPAAPGQPTFGGDYQFR